MVASHESWNISYLEKFKHRLRTQLIVISSLIISITAIGIAGYMLIEHMKFVEALYMTIITLSTVGFGEVKPLSTAGRLFTSGLIVAGVGTFAYAVSSFSRFIVEGEVKKIFQLKKMEEQMRRLKDHIIVCGFGRVGERICEEFEKENVPFVVIDSDPERIEVAESKGYLFVFKDTTETEALVKAGIDRAKALIAALGSDADNLFLILSAKELNPNIRVVARANNPENEAKLYKAGADKVVTPYTIGALRLAHAAIKPLVVDFVEFATRDMKFYLEEITVEKGSPVVGKSLAELDLRKKTGVTVIAIIRNGNIIRNPHPDERLQEGDNLIVLGSKEEIQKVNQLFSPNNKERS